LGGIGLVVPWVAGDLWPGCGGYGAVIRPSRPPIPRFPSQKARDAGRRPRHRSPRATERILASYGADPTTIPKLGKPLIRQGGRPGLVAASRSFRSSPTGSRSLNFRARVNAFRACPTGPALCDDGRRPGRASQPADTVRIVVSCCRTRMAARAGRKHRRDQGKTRPRQAAIVARVVYRHGSNDPDVLFTTAFTLRQRGKG